MGMMGWDKGRQGRDVTICGFVLLAFALYIVALFLHWPYFCIGH